MMFDYIPDYCNGCGEDLQQQAPVLIATRQEVILPPIVARYVAHRSHGKVCTHCGKNCITALPARLTTPIQYGGNMVAMVSYLSVYQHNPYCRIKILLKGFIRP